MKNSKHISSLLFFLPPNRKISSPHPPTPRPDKLIWLPNLNGEFLQPNSLIRQPQTDVRWKKLWKLKYPERIKRIISSATSLISKRLFTAADSDDISTAI